jgi:hypothetical protein
MGKVLENFILNELKKQATWSKKVSPDDFKGLKLLAQNMDQKFIKGIVFYCGSQVVPFGNNLWALPITCLWQ